MTCEEPETLASLKYQMYNMEFIGFSQLLYIGGLYLETNRPFSLFTDPIALQRTRNVGLLEKHIRNFESRKSFISKYTILDPKKVHLKSV